MIVIILVLLLCCSPLVCEAKKETRSKPGGAPPGKSYTLNPEVLRAHQEKFGKSLIGVPIKPAEKTHTTKKYHWGLEETSFEPPVLPAYPEDKPYRYIVWGKEPTLLERLGYPKK